MSGRVPILTFGLRSDKHLNHLITIRRFTWNWIGLNGNESVWFNNDISMRNVNKFEQWRRTKRQWTKFYPWPTTSLGKLETIYKPPAVPMCVATKVLDKPIEIRHDQSGRTKLVSQETSISTFRSTYSVTRERCHWEIDVNRYHSGNVCTPKMVAPITRVLPILGLNKIWCDRVRVKMEPMEGVGTTGR